MKLSYKLLADVAYTTLFDESSGGTLMSEFPPSFQAQVQADNLYKSETQFRKGRGNIACSLPLELLMTYGTRTDAMASIRTYAALLGTTFHIKVEHTEGVVTETQYYPNAVLVSYSPRVQGLSVTHSVQFSSDNVTASAP